eukprot:GSChrysophyteH1.ASY1.ANO1.1111.1 assembled CDS
MKDEKIYYGWVMVSVAALQIFFSGPGQTYSISNWKSSYTNEFMWSQNKISFLYATATITSACLMPFVGRAVDKFGPRRMSLIVSMGLICAAILSSTISSTALCWVSFFFLRFFGQGSMTLIPSTVIPHWFSHRKGRAFSFAAFGGFISAVAYPLVDTWLISKVGWRTAWVIIAGTIAAVFLPVTCILYRDRPEDIGEVCEGYIELERLKKEKANSEATDSMDWELSEIVQTKTFWALMHCNLERAAVNTAITFFIRDICGNIGLSELQAATLLSIQAVVGFPVTLCVGFLLEKMAVHHALAITFALQAISLTVLTNAKSMSMCILFAVVWGVGAGFEQISLQFVWPQYFGKGCLGAVNGSSMASAVLGSALGPMVWGYAYDYNGGHWGGILLGTIPWALLTCVLTWILARRPVNTTRQGGHREIGMYSRVENPAIYSSKGISDESDVDDGDLEEVSFSVDGRTEDDLA